MHSDGLDGSTGAAGWLPLDPTLMGEARATLPAFSLHLPGPWRDWVEAVAGFSPRRR